MGCDDGDVMLKRHLLRISTHPYQDFSVLVQDDRC